MSSPLSGNFQDHYLTLGVNPKADLETIQAAYVQAAKRYHPENDETGDAEKFEAVNSAYEILCDPQLRAEFDKLKGLDQDDGPAQFSGLPFFRSIERGVQLRSALLSVLSDRRRLKPFRPSLSMRDVEATMNATLEELTVCLWYLKQRALVTSDDKSSLQISADGLDFLEANRPSPDTVLPLIKPAALAGAAAETKSQMAPPSTPLVAPAIVEGPLEAPIEEELVLPAAISEVTGVETTSILALLRRASGERVESIARNLAGIKAG